jgi:hypothetical protein
MHIRNLSPSMLKKIELCEARAQGQQEDDYDEESKHEGTLAGIVAHAAAKYWYRPDPAWEQAVLSYANPRDRVMARQQRVLNGILKHPIVDRDVAFKMGIAEAGKDGELPADAASIQDARSLFETITEFYNRDMLNVVFSERRIKGPVQPVGVPVHLIIDLAVDNGGVLDIIDYKTGFIPIDQEEMPSDHQVLMNLVAMEHIDEYAAYPQKTFTFFWARQKRPSSAVTITREQSTDYLYWLKFEYDRVRNLSPETAREQVNRFCESCGRKRKCGAYARVVADAFGSTETFTPEQMAGITPQDLMQQNERLSQQIKLLEANHGFLKEMLMARIKQDDPSNKVLKGDSLQATLVQSQIQSVDTATVIAQAMRCRIPVHTLVKANGKDKVLQAFQGNPEARAQIEATMITHRTSPWVRVSANPDSKKRKVKPNKVEEVSI